MEQRPHSSQPRRAVAGAPLRRTASGRKVAAAALNAHTQRALVVASLLRCPKDGAEARRG
jgi:hypothetical protein